MAKDIITIAGAINTLYKKIYARSPEENDMSEMKMHKLLYFAQKRHFEKFGEWLFDENFEGWVHGPVNKKVRSAFDFLPTVDYDDLTLEEEFTLREILHEYGKYSAIFLRELSHQDKAYKISREGLSEYDRGNEVISKLNIIDDIAEEQSEKLYP